MDVVRRPWAEVAEGAADLDGPDRVAYLVADADGAEVHVWVRPEAEAAEDVRHHIEALLDAMRAGGRDGWHPRSDGGWQVWIRHATRDEDAARHAMLADLDDL